MDEGCDDHEIMETMHDGIRKEFARRRVGPKCALFASTNVL